MAKATSTRESRSKTEVSVYSDTLPTDSQNGNIEKRAQRASIARHARKCTVCHHKDREFIDQDYLRWLSPKKIAREYGISHHSVVYRHADATGLRTQRRASLRATLENFIEQAEDVRATAGSVVAAVRLYAQINDQGQWVPPVRRHIVEHYHVDERSQDQPSCGPNQPAAPTTRQSAAINEPPAPLRKTDGSSSVTSAAVSAARPAQAHKNSGSVDSTRRLQRVATITAGSAVPFSASEDKFPAVPVASMGLRSKDGVLLTPTSAAHSAAPPAQAHNNSDPVSATGARSSSASNAAGPQAATFSAQSAEPRAKAHNNSGPACTASSIQTVATITAGSAVPFGASSEKFPAVPVASVKIATSRPISNREHVELEHAATH
jgi:hypothetical protein